MKKFKDIKEAKEKSVVFSFGRFNPPTTGHEKMIKAASSIAKAQGADLKIFPSQSQDPKKNPLSFTDKVKFMRKMFRSYAKNIVADKSLKTTFDVVSKLHSMGYTRVTMVVGGDRVAEFDKLLNKYNGVEGRHGFYEFENGVEIKSAGNRADPDSDEAKSMTADAMSASVLRKLAADGHFDDYVDENGKKQKGFIAGVPDTLGTTDKRVLFNKIRKGMKLAAINEMFELMFGEALLNEGEQITEDAPPDPEIEKWLEKDATKSEFKRRYGDDWEKVMYATAWKMYNDKSKDEEWNIDEELDEEWTYPQPSVDELFEEFVTEADDKKITKAHLDAIEKYADKLFSKVGIDIQFTKHFLDRVNDERNKKQITNAELVRLFKQTYAKYGKKIAQMGPDAEAVLKDMQTDVNMPFVLQWDSKNKELDLVAKTVMRKKGFKTPDPELVIAGDDIGEAFDIDSGLEEGKFKDVVRATKLVNRYAKLGREEDALEAIKVGWNLVRNPQMRKIIVNAVKAIAEKEGLDWNEATKYIKKKTGIDVMDADDIREGAVSPAQRAAIAISKKEKAGKPGYDKEGKKLKEYGYVPEPKKKAKKLKDMREEYIAEVTSNNLPQIGDVDGDGLEDDPYMSVQVRFVPFEVKIKGFPAFVLWAESIAKVRSHVRITLKYMDDLEYIQRVTDAEVRAMHKRRYDKAPASASVLKTREMGVDRDNDGVDDAYKQRQDAYYRESYEEGTDELVQAYKKSTPGELEEAPRWVKNIIAKFQTNKYEKAARALLDYEAKQIGKQHSIEYYAAELIRMAGSKLDARILAKTAKKIMATEAIFYAKENDLALHEIYRPHSEMYYELFDVARDMNIITEGLDKYLLEETNIGLFERYEGEIVPLDIPLVEDWVAEEADVELNSPKRGGSKKFYVYVKNDKGNVVKVSFGDTSGLKAKINDRDAAKNFASRHQCDTKKDKTTPGYWACRLPMYAKELGLEGGGDYFW